MTSAWVLIIASLLHFGVRGSCFLSVKQLPVLPNTLLARHIAYCAMLHFLYDLELLPARYRRKMGLLVGFLMELVLGVAFMEVLGQWVWCRVEHIAHRVLQLTLSSLNIEVYQHLEGAFMSGLMTSLAGLLWLNAYAATEPTEPAEVVLVAQVVAPSPSSSTVRASWDMKAKQRRRRLAKRKEQLMRRIQKREQQQKQELQLELEQEQEQEEPVEQKQLAEDPEEQQHLTALASTTEC